MIRATLGETIDIHGGGIDLVFPHHENEIAQSETAYDKPLARVWLHNGFLDFAGEKMSKSLGNVVYAHDLLKEWPGEVLRWALLSAHYRAPLEWNRDLLTQSKASLDRLYGALRRVDKLDYKSRDAGPDADAEKPTANAPSKVYKQGAKTGSAALEAAPAAFLEALCDDLNTPQAMAELFALASEANRAVDAGDAATAGPLADALRAAGALMGVLQGDPEGWFRTGDDVAEIDAMVAARTAARKAKDFAEADRLRKALADRGVEVMDNPAGSTWKRTS
jgi:cysteinyl-tRNA synthetase